MIKNARKIKRRDFLAGAAAAAAGGLLLPKGLFAVSRENATLVLVSGADCAASLRAGIEAFGGWSALVKPKARTVLKPNAAWACEPDTGANTSPELVEECVRACLKAGASEVVVPENPCSPAKHSFPKSGIEAAVKRAGGRMYAPSSQEHFKSVRIPLGRSLTSAEVVRDVLEAPFLINMPVAKTHGGATLTLSMKNWMGSVKDRGEWHRSDLHQCIADMSTIIKPTLIVLDAMRIMTGAGPRGPGPLEYPNLLVIGTDPVAVDAYAATLFKKEPFDVKHIRLAHEMGIGCGDLDRIKLVRIDASA